MYEIQREIDVDGVRFRAIKGSVFEAEDYGASGIVIYVPCGLTALRANLPNYMIPYGLPIGEEKMYTIFRNQRKTGVKTILCDENRGNAIYPARGIPMFLNVALSLFEKKGIRRIAMNGIRVYWSDGVKDHGHLAEAFLLDSALQWLDTYEHHFEAIDFVDLRGGFGKAHLENPDEPSIVDPKAMPISSKGGWFSKQNLPIDIEGSFMKREESRR